MKTTPTNMETPKPLGNLSLFPREIRDEIYGYIFPKKQYAALYFDGRSYFVENPHHYSQEWTESNLSILCLSKTIKEEAIALLFSKTVFRLHCSTRSEYKTNPRPLDVDWMTSIELFYNVDASVGPLDLFRGDTVRRMSILIDLRVRSSWDDDNITNLTASPLFDALKQLTGFEEVRLRFTINFCYDHDKPAPGTFEPAFRDMGVLLTPTLGNSSVMSRVPHSHSWEVVFHPREHQAALAKAKKDEASLGSAHPESSP